jgi:hypothetical protein
MIKHESNKRSTNIKKLAAFIVDAIEQKESVRKLLNENNKAHIALKRLWGSNNDRARAEKISSKIRGKLALKAAMERCSKSRKLATTDFDLNVLEKRD